MTPLAHGSGIDDAIIVLLPLAIVVVMLRMGAKRIPPEEPAEGEPGAAAGAAVEAPDRPGEGST